MLHAPSPSRRLAPQWATRLLLAFIVLSLAALIAIPWWASTRHLQPLQHEMNQIADPVRGLMTHIHLAMAQEGNALDDFVDERDALSRGRFFEAEEGKRAAYRELTPLIAALGPVPKQRLDTLLALDDRWHRLVDAEVWYVPSGRIVPHSPAREDIWDDMLVAAAHLDEAITRLGVIASRRSPRWRRSSARRRRCSASSPSPPPRRPGGSAAAYTNTRSRPRSDARRSPR